MVNATVQLTEQALRHPCLTTHALHYKLHTLPAAHYRVLAREMWSGQIVEQGREKGPGSVGSDPVVSRAKGKARRPRPWPVSVGNGSESLCHVTHRLKVKLPLILSIFSFL